MHHGYAALLADLRRLALTLADEKRWLAAQPLLRALHALEPQDTQIAELHERSLPFANTQAALEAHDWEVARRLTGSITLGFGLWPQLLRL